MNTPLLVAALILKGSLPGDVQLSAQAVYTATVDSLLCWIHSPFEDTPRFASTAPEAVRDASGNYELRVPLHMNVSGDPVDLCRTQLDSLSVDLRDASGAIVVELDYEHPSLTSLSDIHSVDCARTAPYNCHLNGAAPVDNQVIGFDIPGFDRSKDVVQSIDFSLLI